MLEEMGAFFDARLGSYEEHQLTCIAGAEEFYPFSAECLPKYGHILDLGCGTGLELNYLFALAPDVKVTGIDLAPGMLEALRNKFPDKELTLIQGSYFDVPFGDASFDAAVSVESLHHFTKEEKTGLYRKLHTALKDGGYFLLTDYFSLSEKEEAMHRRELLRLKGSQDIGDDTFYHYDTPLTVAHEIQALAEGGFSEIEILRAWGATHVIRAYK